MIAWVLLPETSAIDTSSSESVSKRCWARNSSDVGHTNEAEPLMASIKFSEAFKLTQIACKKGYYCRAVAHYA